MTKITLLIYVDFWRESRNQEYITVNQIGLDWINDKDLFLQ